jgi:hypothetical protein
MEAPQKTKNRTAYDPAIPLLGKYPKECESGCNKTPAYPHLLRHYSQ